MLQSLAADIVDYYSEDSTQEWPYLAIVKG